MPDATKNNGVTTEALTRVVEQLEEDIVFGRLRPRERLVEEELVGRFDVKRHIIRQALIQLERVGIVIRKRGKGARVCEFTPTEVSALYTVRELLETQAAGMIPLPADKALVRELTAIHKVHAKAVKSGELGTIYRSNIRFHEVLFAACGNPYLVEAIDLFAMKANVIRFYVGRDPRMFAGSRDQHGEIIEALKMGDRDKLIQLCIDHLQPSPKAYIEAYRALFGEY
ncbi:MAG: GntR family transcriptional regulator [Rhodospirillales bacterium]|nr:GntR family transcriptional regulator [Rhodospirillales bacterium]